MTESALRINQRTQEQEACWREAIYEADRVAQRRGPMSSEEWGKIHEEFYFATLDKRMREALAPINKAEAEHVALIIDPRPLIRLQSGEVVLGDLKWDREPFDKLRAPIIEAYTKGLA